jgi:NDP-sugar pyrophosphorylase family protein
MQATVAEGGPKKLIHDFQVVILAGGSGRRLRPITSEEIPKALLPVANRELLSYQLEFVAKMGFPEVREDLAS